MTHWYDIFFHYSQMVKYFGEEDGISSENRKVNEVRWHFGTNGNFAPNEASIDLSSIENPLVIL